MYFFALKTNLVTKNIANGTCSIFNDSIWNIKLLKHSDKVPKRTFSDLFETLYADVFWHIDYENNSKNTRKFDFQNQNPPKNIKLVFSVYLIKYLKFIKKLWIKVIDLPTYIFHVHTVLQKNHYFFRRKGKCLYKL